MIALLYLAVFAGGLLTIASPCILPVLPFVFARSGRPFARETLPLLGGLVLAFVAVAMVGTAGAAEVAAASSVGRIAALVVLSLAGLSLLSPRLASWVTNPLVRLGARLSRGAADGRRRAGRLATDSTRGAAPGRSFVLGVATGLLWAPCAGPILGLVAGAAAAGARPALAASLFATFGAGAAVALAVGLAASARALRLLRRIGGSLVDVWARRILGAAAVATALVIAFGWDARLFAPHGIAQTAGAEEVLLDRLVPGRQATVMRFVARPATPAPVSTPDEGPLPPFDGATGWLNTGGDGRPLSPDQLRGKVVVVNVWTFECYNCLNALPHIKALAAKYLGQDVVVVGIHTPELAAERVPDNVAAAVRRLGVTYPVALDANYAIWRAFNNEYWPSVYIADRNGRIRFHHFGEGQYDDEDRVVARLLKEPRSSDSGVRRVAVSMVLEEKGTDKP